MKPLTESAFLSKCSALRAFGNISTRDFNSNHNPILEDSVKYFHLFNGILTLISLH